MFAKAVGRRWLSAVLLAASLSSLSVSTFAQSPDADPRFDRKLERTWVDRNGNQQSATFAGVIGENALLKVGTQTIRMPLDQLSDGDVGWVAEVLRREGRVNQLPAKYRDYKPDDSPAAAVPATTPVAPGVTPATPASTAASSIQELREWTDQGGEKLTATFQSVIVDDVLLKPEQGAIVRVPIGNLSPADLKLLQEHFESRGELERLPAEFREPVDVEAATAKAQSQASLATPDEKLRVIRTWADDDGKQIVARFWSLDASAVTLQSETGRGTVALGKLGRDDLIWLQEALRQAGRLTELALPFRDPPDASMSTVELARHRRTGYARKWTSFTGKTMVGQYDRFTEGKVRIFDASGTPSGSDYADFSDADKEYLKERLLREVAGEFFPETLSPASGVTANGSEVHTWTDLDGRQVTGRFVKLDRAGTVVILDDGDGEKAYIAPFFSVDDQTKIKALIDAQNAAARASAATARAEFESRRDAIMSGGGLGSTVPGPGGMGHSPPNIRDHMPDVSDLITHTPPEVQLPVIEWRYKCDKCGTEFDESSGLKQGDKCPVCTQRNSYIQYGVGGASVLAAVVFYLMRQPGYVRKSKSKKRAKSVSH